MLKPALKRLMLGRDLGRDHVREIIGAVMDGQASGPQIAATLVALRLKGETIDEITGAAEAMRSRMTPVTVNAEPLLDTCGTGGDGAGTFNISTAVAFVAAAGGAKVAKHGNRAVSSRSGSADVLSELGVRLDVPAEVAKKCIETFGVGFLFAPNHHPAMKHAGPIRKELGIRTIFNVLGPLTNPAGAPFQLMGVFAKDLTAPLAAVLGHLGAIRAWVVHGEDGLDELTVCGKSHVAQWHQGRVDEFEIDPVALGLQIYPTEGLKGGSPAENASMMRELFAGKRPGAIEDAVALNAGAALHVAGIEVDLKVSVQRAKELIRSGAVAAVLASLVEATNS